MCHVLQLAFRRELPIARIARGAAPQQLLRSCPGCGTPASSPASAPSPAWALCSLIWLKSNCGEKKTKPISVQPDQLPEASRHDLGSSLRSTKKEET